MFANCLSMQAGAHNKKTILLVVMPVASCTGLMPPTWLGILTLNAISLYQVATCTVPSEG